MTLEFAANLDPRITPDAPHSRRDSVAESDGSSGPPPAAIRAIREAATYSSPAGSGPRNAELQRLRPFEPLASIVVAPITYFPSNVSPRSHCGHIKGMPGRGTCAISGSSSPASAPLCPTCTTNVRSKAMYELSLAATFTRAEVIRHSKMNMYIDIL